MSSQDFNLKLVMQVVGFDQATAAIEKTKGSLTKLDSSAATTSSKFTQVGTAFQTAGQKATAAAGMKDRLHASLTKLTGSATTIGPKFTALGTAVQQSGTKATAAATAKDRLTASLQKLTAPLQGVQSKMTALGTSITTAGSKSQAAVSQTNQLGTALQATSTKATAASGGLSRMGTAGAGLLTNFGLLTTSSWSLYNAWDRLEVVTLAADKAQNRVVTSQKAVRDGQQKITDLTNKLTKMRKEGKQGTIEYAQVERELADAQVDLTGKQDKLTVATENAAIKAGDVKEAYAEFYSQLPLLIASLGSAGVGMFTIGQHAKTSAAATNVMTTATKAFRLALIAIPLVAIATLILGIRNNTFGMRDALDAAGKKIGELLPQIQPFLTWLRELAAALGLTGEALDLSKAFELLKNGMLGVFDTLQNMDWGALFEGMLQRASDWLSDTQNWVTLGETLMDTFMKVIDWTQDRVYPVLEDWLDMVIDWVSERKNWEKLGEDIIEMFGKAIEWTQDNVWPIFEPFVTSAVAWASDVKNWEKVGTEIVSGITTFMEAQDWAGIWKTFQDALYSSGEWVTTQLSQIGTKIMDYITANKDIWWVEFQNALWSSGEWLTTQLGTIGENIKSTMTAEGPGWWLGFQQALTSTLTWIGTQLGLIGAEIAKTIVKDGPSWWAGFQEALGATLTWVTEQIGKLGREIIKTINKDGPSWWAGFQQGLTKTLTWVGSQIGLLGAQLEQEIVKNGPSWWKGFQEALGASTEWVATQIQKVATAILDFDWLKLGGDIWSKISSGIQAAAGSLWDVLTKGGIQGAEASSDGGNGGQIPVVPSTKVDYDITPAIGKLDQLKAYVTQTTTQISAMFLTMSQSIGIHLAKIAPAAQLATSQTSAAFSTMWTSIQGSLTRITGLFPTTFTTLPGLAMTATSQASAAFITMMTSIQGSLTQISAIFPTAFATLAPAAMAATSQTSAHFVTMLSSIQGTFTQITNSITGLQTAFSDLSSNVATYASSMTTNIDNWLVKTSAGFVDYVAIIKDGVQQAFSDLSTNVATYMNSMTTNIDNWATATTTSMDEVGTAAHDAQEVLSGMSSSVATYMNSMINHVEDFASACIDSFGSVQTSAEDATAAVNQLQSAIDSLQDKEITIHVGLEGPGVAFMRHGGSTLNFGAPAYAAGGATWIQKSPRKIGSTHVAETFPEIITAIPLDPKEKASPFHDLDMKIPVPIVNTGIQQPPITGGGGGPTVTQGNVYVTVQLPNGEALARVVKPFMLTGYSGITSS